MKETKTTRPAGNLYHYHNSNYGQYSPGESWDTANILTTNDWTVYNVYEEVTTWE